jgi:hypothetical protein
MAARELGAHRDAHLELETLGRKSGPILETAVQGLIKIHAPYFKQIGPDLRHLQTGETIEEWMAKRRKNAPHDYADFVPDDADQLLHLYTSEAFGPMCSPKTVGRLFSFMKDPVRFAALAKAWGCDTVRMLPGKRPGSDEANDGAKDGAKPKAEKGDNNPYNLKKEFGSETVRANECAKYIVAFGAKAAARSAAKYGTDLAGRPLRRDTGSR